MELFNSLIDNYQIFISENPWLAIIATFLLPLIEAIIPTLPLAAIIGINLGVMSQAFGPSTGIFLTILFSVAGSFTGMFSIFLAIRKTLAVKFSEKVENNEIGRKFLNIAQGKNIGMMMVFLANPFMPSSILNYALSFTKIKTKSYIWMNIISRLIIMTFFVFLGSLFDIQNHPLNVIWLSLVYALVFLIIFIFKKKSTVN